MRTTYIISYDIRHPKRLKKTHKCLLGWGDPIQYSVFRCSLTDSEHLKLTIALKAIINHHQDQILIINLGPERSRPVKWCMKVMLKDSHGVRPGKRLES
jgi:CRISPR-associated protein Cas2